MTIAPSLSTTSWSCSTGANVLDAPMMRIGLPVGFLMMPKAAVMPEAAALTQPSDMVRAALLIGSALPQRGLAAAVAAEQTYV